MTSNYAWLKARNSIPGRPTRFTLFLVGGASVIIMMFMFAGHQYSDYHDIQPFINYKDTHPKGTCSPEDYSAGSWKPAHKFPPGTKMKDKTDAIAFGGYEGCAADREFFWHLGTDRPDQWKNRFPMAYDHVWSPGEGCNIRPLDREALVTDLVQKGGWLLVGDSVTENHFFSLSCLLYPHVRATPNYTENPYFERDWQQNLYLLPTSPLVPKLKFPEGFSIENTPLVTFRRVDFLLSREELERLYDAVYPSGSNPPLFSEEAFWTLSPSEYLAQFTSKENNYQTMIVNSAGHWTVNVLQAMKDVESKGGGVGNILHFFQHATAMWADLVQKHLDKSDRKDRQVVVRAYLSGHENCFNLFEPYTYIHEYTTQWWNWNWITEYNYIFQVCMLLAAGIIALIQSQWLLNSALYPNIHFLSIDRPGMLRPDAVSSSPFSSIITDTFGSTFPEIAFTS